MDQTQLPSELSSEAKVMGVRVQGKLGNKRLL